MRKNKDISWNSYHDSPRVIKVRQEFCKSKTIAELIRLRDSYIEIAKEQEAREDFYRWETEETEGWDYLGFLYEDALAKISFFCSVIKQKRDNMFMFNDRSVMQDTYRKAAESVLEFVKKNQRIAYDEVVSRMGENSQIALDYLIENGCIERRGTIENNYWKIL